MKRTGKRMLVIGMVLVCILAAGIGAGIVYTKNSPIRQMENALNCGEYDAVQTIYLENKLEYDFKNRADDILSDFANECYDKYLEQEATFEDTIELLGAIGFYSRVPSDIIQEVRGIEASRKAYLRAEEEFHTENYKAALKDYKLVTENDAINYELAQQGVDNCVAEMRKQAQNEADQLLKNQNYKETVLLINSLSKQVLNYELSKIKDDAIQQLQNQADAYGANESYKEAIDLLSDNNGKAIDDILSPKIEEYQKEQNIILLKAYKNQVTTKYDSIEKYYLITPRGTITFPSKNCPALPMLAILGIDTSASFSIGVGFRDKNWVFMDEVLIDCGTAQFTLPVDYLDRNTKVEYGGILEWTVFVHDPREGTNTRNLQPIIKAMEGAEKVTFRFKGDWNKDVVVSPSVVKQIINLWNVYEALEADPSLVSYLI